jgi:phage portal protein BeeE
MMNIRNIFKAKKQETRDDDPGSGSGALLPLWAGGALSPEKLRLSTVYRCVELISSSVAQLPITPYHVFNGKKRIAYEQAAYNLFK